MSDKGEDIWLCHYNWEADGKGDSFKVGMKYKVLQVSSSVWSHLYTQGPQQFWRLEKSKIKAVMANKAWGFPLNFNTLW